MKYIILGEEMINKQGLIFLTLTSLILVLSVYYVTMPTELLLTTNSSYINNNEVSDNNKEVVKIEEENTISAMKSILNDERRDKVKELNNKLIKEELTIEEKNNIYDEIKIINKLETIEEDIEKIIKDEYKLDSFVKVKDDIIEITIQSIKHDKNLVAKIMTSIEKKYNNMYISIAFKA